MRVPLLDLRAQHDPLRDELLVAIQVVMDRQQQLFQKARLEFELDPPFVRPDSRHIFHQYVVRVPQHRDMLMKHLDHMGVGTKIYYPIPLHEQECFQYLGYQQGAFPEAERAARETFALPCFPELTDEQQEYVVAAVGSFQASGSFHSTARP